MSSEVKVRVSLQSGVQAGLTKVKAQFSEFRKHINGEVGNLLAAGALTAGIEKMAESGAELVHLSERFGVPIKSLQEIGNAAKANGATLEDVAKAYNKLFVNQEKARKGNEELRGKFQTS